MVLIKSYPLDQKCEFFLRTKEVKLVDERYRDEVDAIWDNRSKSEFDGYLISLLSYSPEVIIGELVEYRAWYATRKSEPLKRALNIYPIGVSGTVRLKESLLIGRRSSSVSTYVGALECVPTGSVDLFSIDDTIIDVRKAILSELEQEAHILSTSLQSLSLGAIYYCPGDENWDVHIDISLKDDFSTLGVESTDEYDQFFWISSKNKQDFQDKPWVPLSKILLSTLI